MTENWLKAERTSLPSDWAARPTYRLKSDNGQTAIMIETTPDNDPRTLEGHKIADFVRIAHFLRAHNIKAPDIYEADPEHGLLIVEDFGAHNYRHHLPDADKDFYPMATQLLANMRHIKPQAIGLKSFKENYIYKRTIWFHDDYLAIDDMSKRKDFLSLWDNLISKTNGDHFVHGDFHPGNLMPLPNNQIGLLDFGAAMMGDNHYDLVNLLEDVRRDVPSDIKAQCQNAFPYDHDVYVIFHAQFLMRILGQMARRNMPVPDTLKPRLIALLDKETLLKDLKALVIEDLEA